MTVVSGTNVGIGAAIAGAGQKVGGFLSGLTQQGHELNSLMLQHHLNAQTLQMAHGLKLDAMTHQHLLDMDMKNVEGENALKQIRAQGSSDRRTATHNAGLEMKKTEHKQGIQDASWKNRAEFALTNQKQFAPGSKVEIHEHGLDFQTPPAPEAGPESKNNLAAKNRQKAAMKRGRGRI